MTLTRYFSRITLITMLLVFLFSFSAAYAGDEPEPNFEQNGVHFYLSAPDTLTIEMQLLGTHNITLEDGVSTTIEWEYDVPAETIGHFSSTVSYLGVDFSRSVNMVVVNQLILTYSRAAYESGQQFLSGELTQHIMAYETLVSTFPVDTRHAFSQVEVVVSQLQAGNFEAISEGSMQVSFPVSSRQITGELENGALPSYLAENYETIEIIAEHMQTINLPPDFIAMIIEIIEDIPTEIPTTLPQVTPMVTLEPAIAAEVEAISEQAEVIYEQAIPEPSTVEIVVSAVSAAVAVGAAGAVASAAGGAAGAAGGVGTAAGSSGAAAASSVLQGAANAAGAGGAGSAAISFLKDIITGLRDMFMDEGRAHASGKMSENLKKLRKK